MRNKGFNIFGKIFGKVQGVGYREWARKKANHLKLKGWIKNCKDSTVEFEVNGKKKMLTHLLKNAIRDHYLAELIGLIFSRKICRTIKKHL